MESLLHAREWITLPATLYAIEKLVIDVEEQDLLQNIDWIIMPIANPDGYEWTHTNVSIFNDDIIATQSWLTVEAFKEKIASHCR